MFSRRRIPGLAACLVIILTFSGPALAADSKRELPPAGWTFLTLDRNFDRILADWREPYTGFRVFGVDERDSTASEGSVGAYVCLARNYDPDYNQTWQIGVEGAFYALFDWASGGSLQSRATDYRVGLNVSYSRGPFSAKLALGHLSSHPGDFHLRNENANTPTIFWEDLKGLVSYQANEWLRIYAGGTLYITHTEDAGNADVQFGTEMQFNMDGTSLRPYLALDVQAKDRSDWNVSTAVEGGLRIPGFDGRVALRLYGFYYQGDDPSGVFSTTETTRYGIGFSLDY